MTPRSRGCGRPGSPTAATGSRARRARRRSPSGGAVELGRDALLVERVSGLVQRAEQRVRSGQLLAYARGDAHVAERELGHEGVVRSCPGGRASKS
ncbi:MAG: hypothetical protein MZV63_33420 [Marinilabiliales bacterium]|nr:hypothetical protein [Marinilabiliales bacterium]